MKPLHVLLVVKATVSAFLREGRNMGQFSYPVEQFTWEHMVIPKGGSINRADYAGKFDVIFHEDAPGCTYEGDGPPVIFYDIDSTLTDDHHYRPRLEQAKQANLILVDHDRLGRFNLPGIHTRRLSYCVNDRLFFDRGLERDLDVVFHCPAGNLVPGGDERRKIRVMLDTYCKQHGLTYVSGAIDIVTYANHFARAKVVVSWARTIRNRPHRVLDATASGACLLTSPLPPTEDVDTVALPIVFFDQINCLIAKDSEELPSRLDEAFEELYQRQTWQGLAERSHKVTMELHTWRERAKELRTIIADEFGI